VSVTGIAGPGGGTETKPVGLVYIGLCVGGEVSAREFKFMGNRDKIRERAVVNALDMVRRAVIKLR
jgi:nicotinamide-nucleotide amidase